MNEQQMKFLAVEMAEDLMTKLAPIFVLRELSESDLELVKQAFELSYLQGLGRGIKDVLHGVRAAIV